MLTGTARPASTGSSVSFLIAASGGDEQLAQARRWAQAVVDGSGGSPEAQLAVAGPDADAIATQVLTLALGTLSASLAGDVLDGRLGGLRAHTLVLLVRAEADGSLFFFPPDTRHRLDAVTLKRGAVSGSPIAASLRDSTFDFFYLAACGPGDARPIARELRSACGRTVFCTSGLQFPAPPAASFAEAPGVKGLRYFKPDLPANRVALRTDVDTFLQGSEERLP